MQLAMSPNTGALAVWVVPCYDLRLGSNTHQKCQCWTFSPGDAGHQAQHLLRAAFPITTMAYATYSPHSSISSMVLGRYENICGASVYYSVKFAQVGVTVAVFTRHRCAHLGAGGSVTVMVFLRGITPRRFLKVHIDVPDIPPGSHKWRCVRTLGGAHL